MNTTTTMKNLLSRILGPGLPLAFAAVLAACGGDKAATGPAADTTAPTAPSNLVATAVSPTQINLTWTAATDNVAVTSYRVMRGSTQAGVSTGTNFNDTNLTPDTVYNYTVVAIDAAGNLSAAAARSARTLVDSTAPAAPTNVVATAVSPTQINLTWTAATDNVGVTGYRVMRGAALAGTSAVTSFSDTGLTPDTNYGYTVLALDAANNVSTPAAGSARTPAASSDTTAPSAPANVQTTAVSSTQIDLTWTASTDNVGVTGYRVERCTGSTCTTFAQVGASATNSYSDTGLGAGTTYRYRVRATDAAMNLSAFSPEVSRDTLQVAPTLTRTTLMSGRSEPWDLGFLPDGTMFFTEKCRGLSVRMPSGTVNPLLGMGGQAGLFPLVRSDLFCEGQSGMHGVAVDPEFATNRYVYVYSASNLSSNPRTNRVLRVTVNAGLTAATATTDIITDIAFKHVGNAVGGSGAHSGGRVRFGLDNFLYITTGDNHNATLPQDPVRLGGKVLRVDRNGAAAPGNNPPAGFDPRIYTYGHRNVQGIAFRPGTGQPFTAEHGPNHSDEVTPLVAGGNAGWDPQNRAGLNCPDNYCGYAGNASTMPMTDMARFPGAMAPAWANGGASQGMGPATFLSGAQWRAWDGRLAVSIMGGDRTDILQLNAAGMATGSTSSGLPSARMRSLVQGPDGNLYVATDAGEIWRVVPN